MNCTLDQIYDNLTITSDDAKARRTCFPGHYFKVKDEVIHVIFCNLLHSHRGRKPLTYPDTLVREKDLPTYN